MSATRTAYTACNLCEAMCGLELTITDGAVTAIRGNEKDPLSRGHICPKGVALADIYADPDRLTRPIKKVDGEWVETSWDDALDLVADRVAETINRHGKDAVALYLGNPNVHSLGAMTHGTTFVGSFRTRNKYSATSVDQLPHQLVAHLLYGHQLLVPVPDLDRTDFVLMFGANPMASNGSLMTAPDFPTRVRELKARDGRLVVVDPRRTETARVATEHHFVRPGADAWVLLAMLNVLYAEGLTTPPAYVKGLDAVEAAVASFSPELAEQRSGIPADTIRGLTRDFAAADAAAAYGRIGVSTQEFGTVCQWALQMLNLLTGNLDRVGGVQFTAPAIDAVGKGLIGRGHHDRFRSRVRDLPEFGGELPVAALREEIETPGEGQVRTLLTSAGNPVLSTPDGAGLGRALDGLDFMASVDIYLNETTRHADVILPPTTHLERDHYDLALHVLAIRDTARFSPAVFPKSRDQRHDWEIYRDLDVRITARLRDKGPLRRRLERRLRLMASPTFLIANLLRFGGRTSITALRRHPEGVDLGPLQAGRLPERLQTKDRLIDAAPALVLADLDRLRDSPAPAAGELVLIGRRHQKDCNSWMHNSERLVKGRERHQLMMNPADLEARGLVDGKLVEVRSRVGSVQVEVTATDTVMPGVVSLPHGFGHAQQGARMHRAAEVAGVSINDLTDPERLDVSGNTALSGVPVTVSPA